MVMDIGKTRVVRQLPVRKPILHELGLLLDVVGLPWPPGDVVVGSTAFHSLVPQRVHHIAPGKSLIMPLPDVRELMDEESLEAQSAEGIGKTPWTQVQHIAAAVPEAGRHHEGATSPDQRV
jgi:hypothetical protein